MELGTHRRLFIFNPSEMDVDDTGRANSKPQRLGQLTAAIKRKCLYVLTHIVITRFCTKALGMLVVIPQSAD